MKQATDLDAGTATAWPGVAHAERASIRCRPRISVIVPCYNYGRYLDACVESIVSQPGVDASVLIIDDCSTDGSFDVATSLARAHPRVEATRHPVNKGHIATYNEGLEWISGDYTLLLSADDLLAPGALARAATVFEAHPEVGLVYGRAVLFPDGSPVPPPRVSPGRAKVWAGQEWIATRCRLGRTGIESPEAIVRTDVHRLVGGYRPELPHTGDSELWLRVAHHADVAFVCADQAYHRTHPASMYRSQFSDLRADYVQRRAAFETALLGGRRAVADADVLYGVASRALAADLLWYLCRSAGSGEQEAPAIDDYVELAREFYPRLEELPELRALTWRRKLGWFARYAAPAALPGMVAHRLRRLNHQFGSLWWRNLNG